MQHFIPRWSYLMALFILFPAQAQVRDDLDRIPRVGAVGVEPPVSIHKEAPEYPETARAQSVTGYAIVDCVVKSDGSVSPVSVMRCIPPGDFGFEDAAMAAVKKWKFLPGKVQGPAADVRMTVKVDFRPPNAPKIDTRTYVPVISTESFVVAYPDQSMAEGDLNALSIDQQLIEHVKSGDLKNARDVLDRGADANARDGLGYRGVQNNRVVPQNRGYTALMICCERGHDAFCDVLLKKGADVNGADPSGVTPLIIGARKENLALIQKLVSAGARIDHQTEVGETALHAAVGNGNLLAMRFLLQHGADPNLRSKDGVTALDLAQGFPINPDFAQNQETMIEELKARGAK